MKQNETYRVNLKKNKINQKTPQKHLQLHAKKGTIIKQITPP